MEDESSSLVPKSVSFRMKERKTPVPSQTIQVPLQNTSVQTSSYQHSYPVTGTNSKAWSKAAAKRASHVKKQESARRALLPRQKREQSSPTLPPFLHYTRTRKLRGKFRRLGRNDVEEIKGRIGAHCVVSEIDTEGVHMWAAANEQFEATAHFDVLHLRWRRPEEELEFVVHRDTANLERTFPDDSMIPSGDDTGMGFSLSELAEREMEYVDVFVFSFGVIVFWNMKNESEELTFLEKLKPWFVGAPHPSAAIDSAVDDMNFYFGVSTVAHRDEISLTTSKIEEKLAVSFAVAQSTLLSVYEWKLEQTIQRNSHIPYELARTGNISMSQEDISKEVGQLFLDRHLINLDSILLETPEVFWEDDTFEPVFDKVSTYLDVEGRLDIVNKRLDMIRELHEVMIGAAETRHAVRLEWIIIWLIVIEIVVEVISISITIWDQTER